MQAQGYYNDHDLEQSQPFLKLLGEGETYIGEDIEVPVELRVPPLYSRCSACIYGGGSTFKDLKEFVWHVQKKYVIRP